MRRFRFSLRFLLVLVTVLAILIAVSARPMLNARKQRQLITLIQSYGGENHHGLNFKNGTERTVRFPDMEFSPTLPGPEWLRHRIGDEYFVSVVEALFDKGSHRVLDDAMFKEFTDQIRSRNLPRPRGLVFSGLPITDSALKELSAFPNLTSLHIVNCPGITDAGLRHIGSLTKLRQLDLRGSSVSDQGLSWLTNLAELRELSLRRTSVTDNGLSYLENMTNLEYLSLCDTLVTFDEFRALDQRLPKCEIVF